MSSAVHAWWATMAMRASMPCAQALRTHSTRQMPQEHAQSAAAAIGTLDCATAVTSISTAQSRPVTTSMPLQAKAISVSLTATTSVLAEAHLIRSVESATAGMNSLALAARIKSVPTATGFCIHDLLATHAMGEARVMWRLENVAALWLRLAVA